MSKLRVNDILPANGLNIGIGTADGNFIVGGASTTVVVNGDVNAKGNLQASGITTSNAGFMFGTDGEHYLYKSGANTASLRITSDGPYAEFKDVSGDVQIGSASGTLLLSAGANERVSIGTDGNTVFSGQRHRFNFTNSGGVGPFLSLRNTGTATGSITGICFGIGSGSADLDGTDYGEGQIKVYNDSGSYGNMEFNLHTGANRSYLKIVGNGQAYNGASSGAEGMRGGVAFGNAGIAIDRSWTGQPGIHVFNENNVGDTDQGTFRFHGWSRSYASYPASSGSDFAVNVVGDGSGFSSDERKKTGITTITNALNTVSQMRGVSYQFLNSDLIPQTHMTLDNGTKLGFVAQEVIPVLPSIVIDAGGENAVPHENGYCDRYAIDYGSVTALLVEAIKDLKADKEALEARIVALEG